MASSIPPSIINITIHGTSYHVNPFFTVWIIEVIAIHIPFITAPLISLGSMISGSAPGILSSSVYDMVRPTPFLCGVVMAFYPPVKRMA